jgi:hypothetical protein
LLRNRFKVFSKLVHARINRDQAAVAGGKSGESSRPYYGSSVDQFYSAQSTLWPAAAYYGSTVGQFFPRGISSYHDVYREGGQLLDVNRNPLDMDREKARRPPKDDYIELVVELPPGSMERTRRKFWVPREATAGEVINHLAQHFRVGRDWNLYTRQQKGEIPTPILDKDVKLNEYNRLDHKEAQLYFYPEVLF